MPRPMKHELMRGDRWMISNPAERTSIGAVGAQEFYNLCAEMQTDKSRRRARKAAA